MDNKELIRQTRELCNTAETNYYIDVVIPQLCDALEAEQKEIEQLNGDYDATNRAYHEWLQEAENLRNELCLKCGKYHDAHLGARDDCRWKK